MRSARNRNPRPSKASRRAEAEALLRSASGRGKGVSSNYGAATLPLLKIGFLISSNFTLSSLSAFIDVLRIAAVKNDWRNPERCAWTVMTPGKIPVLSSCGLSLVPNDSLVDPQQFDYIAVVGGALELDPALHESCISYLKRAASLGLPLIGVSTGSFLLCRAELMAGRRCCVHWQHYRDFLEEFTGIYPVADQLYLIDGDRITCPGGVGVVDLALHLVAKHCGPDVAQRTLRIMQLDHARPPEQPQPVLHAEFWPAHPMTRRVIRLMEEHVSEPLRLGEVAAQLGLNARRLQRLFKQHVGRSPLQIYRRIRIRHAEWLLRTTDRSMTEIGQESGFGDGAQFSREIRREFGKTPMEIRREGSAAVGL